MVEGMALGDAGRRSVARVKEFLLEVKGELLQKVTYPTRAETMGSTTVVIILVIIAGLFLAFVDYLLVNWISRIIQ